MITGVAIGVFVANFAMGLFLLEDSAKLALVRGALATAFTCILFTIVS